MSISVTKKPFKRVCMINVTVSAIFHKSLTLELFTSHNPIVGGFIGLSLSSSNFEPFNPGLISSNGDRFKRPILHISFRSRFVDTHLIKQKEKAGLPSFFTFARKVEEK